MVSLWPFKGNNTDAATFEKTLSSLAKKISKASSTNDSLRQQARRLRVGWLIYGGFAYILVFLILFFVPAWQEWGPVEYTVIAGGPLMLYAVKVAIASYYNWRIKSSQDHLDSLYKQRDTTIDKLKKATKYDSTQQLLDKYGSPKPSSKQKDGKQASPKGRPGGQQEQRVFRQPPPTANIQRSQPPAPQSPGSSQQLVSAGNPSNIRIPSGPPQSSPPPIATSPQSPSSPGEEFAPNAFGDAPAQYAPAMGQSRWYDRIMDALLGEDETQARSRIALICQKCRLVNGQAPPGTKTLEEIGKWRCGACGAWNGEESEANRAMQQLTEHGDLPVPTSPTSPTSPGHGAQEEEPEGWEADEDVDDAVVVSHEADDGDAEEVVDTPAKSTRSRKKAR